MKIIVDANIVFSGILNTNGKIGDLLINSTDYFEFIAPTYLKAEIKKHHNKLIKISGLSEEKIQEAEFQICNDIRFISEEKISKRNWKIAEKLVADIDPKDVQYVAYANEFKCKIWSGDKQLINGLAKKGFKKFIPTTQLFLLKSKMI